MALHAGHNERSRCLWLNHFQQSKFAPFHINCAKVGSKFCHSVCFNGSNSLNSLKRNSCEFQVKEKEETEEEQEAAPAGTNTLKTLFAIIDSVIINSNIRL